MDEESVPPYPHPYPSPLPPPPHRLHTVCVFQGGVEVANAVMKVYAEEEGLEVDDALPLNLELCRSYLLVLATGDEWKKALELFWKLAEAGGSAEGRAGERWPEPDGGCCEAALVACRRAGKWREALQVFRHVRREDVGVELTAAMYMSTIMTMLLVSSVVLWIG